MKTFFKWMFNSGFLCRSELSSDLDPEKFKRLTANFLETSNLLILK